VAQWAGVGTDKATHLCHKCGTVHVQGSIAALREPKRVDSTPLQGLHRMASNRSAAQSELQGTHSSCESVVGRTPGMESVHCAHGRPGQVCQGICQDHSMRGQGNDQDHILAKDQG